MMSDTGPTGGGSPHRGPLALLSQLLWQPRGWWLVAAGFLATLALVITPHLWTGGDDSRNLLAAKSYLAGYGFRLVPNLAEPEYVPDRLFIFILALAMRVVGEKILILKLIPLISAAGAGGLLFLLCRDHGFSPRMTLTTLLLFLTSPLLAMYIDILIPEVPFLVVSMLVCWAGERYLRSARLFDGWLALTIGGWLVLRGLGNAALIVAIAFGLMIPLRKPARFRRLTILVPLAGIGGYLIHYFVYYRASFLELWHDNYFSPGIRLYNLVAYALKYLPAQLFPFFSQLSFRYMNNRYLLHAGYVVGAGLTVLMAIGFWHFFLARRSLIGGLILVTLAILVYWHTIEGGRFLFILLPYLLMVLVSGLLRTFRWRWTWVPWAFLGLLLVNNLAMILPQIWEARTGATPPALRSYEAAVRWVAAHDPGATVALRKPHPALWGRAQVTVTALLSVEAIHRQQPVAEFVIADVYRPWSQNELPALLAQSGWYDEVFRTSPPVVVVYQVRKPPRAGTP